MKKLAAFSGAFALLSLVFVCAAGAESFGDSGGMKNESDVAVKVIVTYSTGDYESLVLAAGASFDFPENAARIKIGASVADPPGSRSRIRVAVIQPDGSRQELNSLESEAIVYRRNPRSLQPARGDVSDAA